MPIPVNSNLRLSGIGVPPYSSRDLSEVLTIIDNDDVVRTINKELVDFGELDEEGHKYKVTITGHDMRPPACSGVWKGKIVTVDCITYLAYDTLTGTPERTVVPGSVIVEAGFTYYRPRLLCRVMDWSTDTPEYQAQCNWTMVLEEI
jgi:hypothetical protein